MRSLFLFIWKYYFFFLFFLLEALSVYFLVRTNSFHRTSFVSSANNISGSVLQSYSDINEYFHLREANEQLAKENAMFHSMELPSFIRSYGDTYSFNDSVYKQQYEYISAKVVNNSTNRRSNYLTLNKGSKQGIKQDMAVISSTGVIGIVKDVSDNFSSVMSLLHKDTKVSSKIKKDGSFGPLSWMGEDYRYAVLTDIPTHVRLVKGDTIITSAYSATFPEGILVGTVESFERKSGEYFYTVKVKLSTDFKKLNYVYVVTNILKEEQENLEKISQND